MRVLVTGGRDYTEWQKVHSMLDALHARYGITMIIQGGANGADFFAATWAQRNKVKLETEAVSKDDWERVGKSAGVRRNEYMFDKHMPQLVVAFEGDRGTQHMVGYAAGQGCPTLMVPDLEWRIAKQALVAQDTIDLEGYSEPKRPYWIQKPGSKDKWPVRVVHDPVAIQAQKDRYTDEAMF